MLVVHPSSSCDVCLEGYTSRPQNTPYSISCGHVFCLNCLKSLRQHICPLCRSPFDISELRRLHVDRTDSQPGAAHRTPSPRRTDEQRSELPSDNALGLVDDIPRATQLQQKISDLVLTSTFTTGVRERGVRELLQEVHAFVSTEPQEKHSELRASFLLLYRFTELHARYQQLETNSFDLRAENNRNKQAAVDWERRYQDLQRSRARDQESAMAVEASLRERLRIEELDWQRKYDFVSEECAKLRDELDKLRYSSPNARGHLKAPHRTASATQPLYVVASQNSGDFDGERAKFITSGKDRGRSKAKDDFDTFSHFNPDLFHISPVPAKITLCSSKQTSDSDDETPVDKYRNKAPESPSRTSSTSSNISRASDSAAALKSFSPFLPIRATPNRQRSDSHPVRRSDNTSINYSDNQPEVSSSAPSSYMYRAASPTRALFPTTPPPSEGPVQESADAASVARLYSLLERPVPAPDPRFTNDSSYLDKTQTYGPEQKSSRPPIPRSASYQQVRSSNLTNTAGTPSGSVQSSLLYRRTQPHIQVQTSLLSASHPQRSIGPSPPQTSTPSHTQFQASETISPIQRTPPRPVLPHMHSYFSLYSPAPAKPVSPKENHVGVRGTLPRRGSLSSASAAARAASSGSGSPAVVPPSSLGFGKSHGRGLFGGQDSDA